MRTEILVLAATIIFGLLQLFLAAFAELTVRGAAYNAGNREEDVPSLKGVPARLKLAFENFKETFPFFAAAVLMSTASGAPSWLSYWGSLLYFVARLIYLPVYAAGIIGLRTVIWILSMAGLVMVLASVFQLRG